MHIIGATGEGKSKFIEHMIREDIRAGHGLCLIDPHGDLYNDIVDWCTARKMLAGGRQTKIILFDPSQDKWTFGFNPLEMADSEISFFVDAMVRAVSKVWGGTNLDNTPLLKRCLRILFHALIEKKLSLLEAGALIDPAKPDIRKYITHGIQDRIINQQWEYFNTLKPMAFYNEFGSTINKMMEFLSSPIIKNIIGQTENTVDFRKLMDEGHILLVNLSTATRLSEDNARLLGTLIVNDLFMKAKGRSKSNRRPFYLYIDECARYVNEDIGRILDEMRKFGLHLILAHQHLKQLTKAGDEVYTSIMQNARTKVVFGGLSVTEAEILAPELFVGEYDLEEGKKSLDKPVVVGYVKEWLKSHSTTTSHSSGSIDGQNIGSSWGQVTGDPLAGGTLPISSQSMGKQDSQSKGWQETVTDGETSGESEAYVPILEERTSSVYSLPEQIYKSVALMVNQPQRQAIVKFPKQKVRFIKTPFIRDEIVAESAVERFKEKSFELCEYAQPISLIAPKLEKRLMSLEQEVEEREAPRKEPKQFQEKPSAIWE